MFSCYNTKGKLCLRGRWPLKIRKRAPDMPVMPDSLLPRLLVCGGLVLLLVLAGLWLNRPDGSAPTASSQLVFVPAKVTAVLSDNA